MIGISSFFFFFNDTAPTEIYTLSLHDALPISISRSTPLPLRRVPPFAAARGRPPAAKGGTRLRDRKSTRLNSRHVRNSYAVFCLKKKKKNPLLRPLNILFAPVSIHHAPPTWR